MSAATVIARLVTELDAITDPDEAVNTDRIGSYVSEDLHTWAWELAVARWASLRADLPSRRRVAERDCEQAAAALDAIGLHDEARTVLWWVQTRRGRSTS